MIYYYYCLNIFFLILRWKLKLIFYKTYIIFIRFIQYLFIFLFNIRWQLALLYQHLINLFDLITYNIQCPIKGFFYFHFLSFMIIWKLHAKINDVIWKQNIKNEWKSFWYPLISLYPMRLRNVRNIIKNLPSNHSCWAKYYFLLKIYCSFDPVLSK